MPLNNFSVGRDVSITIQTSTGPLTANLVTSFESHQQTIKKAIKGLDGISRNVVFPNGWAGRLEIERQDSTLDDFFAALEANYYAGQNIPTATITETITEVTGGITQYQYTQCVLSYEHAGTWKGDDTIKLQLGFEATQRLKLQ